jgi:hypothetical protein
MLNKYLNIIVALLYSPVYYSILLLDNIRENKLRVEKALSGANEGKDI